MKKGVLIVAFICAATALLYVSCNAVPQAAETEAGEATSAEISDKAEDTAETQPASMIVDTDPSLSNEENSNAVSEGESNQADVAQGSGIPQNADLNSGESGAVEDEILARCIAELTAYQDALMTQLGELLQAAQKEWNDLPAEERTDERKQELILNGLNQCYDLEDETDAKVQEILAQYRAQMESIGGDVSLINALWDTYETEKENTEAYYINLYLN